MAAIIGNVIDYQTEADENGDGTILTLNVRISDSDPETVELMRHAGVDYAPPTGSSVCIVAFNDDYRVAVACDDGVEPTVDVGEYEIYGSDSGAKVSYVGCRNDGQVELNGTGDYAVRYDELKAEFDAFVSVFNAHTHPYVDTGGASPTATSVTTTTADTMTDAPKVDTVEVPDG